MQGKIALGRFAQADAAVKRIFYDAGKIEIAQLGQNEVVNLVERPLGQRQIAAPDEIIENIRHAILLKHVHHTIYTVFLCETSGFCRGILKNC